MTEILPMGPTARPSGMRAGRGRVRYHGQRPSRLLLWTMLLLVGLSPLPLGSNRPVFWGLSAVAFGLTLLVWTLGNRRNGTSPAVVPRMLRTEVCLFAGFMACLAIQTLPIGSWVGALASAGLDGLGVVPRAISISPADTFLMIMRQLTYATVFYLMLQVASRDSHRSMSLDGLLLIICINAVVALASLRMGDTILGLPKWAYPGSATGTFVNRNSFSTFQAFGAVLASAQLMDIFHQWVKNRRDDWSWRQMFPSIMLYLSALLLILAAVVASQSRMGFVVTLSGMLVVAGLSVWRNRQLLWGVLIMGLVAMVAVISVLLAYGDGLIERMDVLEKSGNVRLALYQQVLELIAIRPWFGFGGGSFELAFPLVHQLPVSGDAVWDKAHNSYFALWADLGLIAGSIPIVLFGWIALRILRLLLAGKGSWRSQTAALGVIVVGAVHSTVDFSLEIQANTVMFLAIISLGYATVLKQQK